MDQVSTRAARLERLRNRWFSEPLGVIFPPFAEYPDPPPATLNELIRGERFVELLSADTDDRPGDSDVHRQHFPVTDPKQSLTSLCDQIDRAPGGSVTPVAIKEGYLVLSIIHADSEDLAAHYASLAYVGNETARGTAGEMHAVFAADTAATAQALKLVKELADELGISLPVNRGVQQGY